MGRAGNYEADILPRSRRPGWDGAGRHVEHGGEQAARAMEPVVDFTPGPMRFANQNGVWQFQWDGSYLRGTLPGPQEFANAGVQ